MSKVYECSKCGCEEYVTGELRGSGGGATAWMNLDIECFGTVSCKKCGFTDFYKHLPGKYKNVLAFLDDE